MPRARERQARASARDLWTADSFDGRVAELAHERAIYDGMCVYVYPEQEEEREGGCEIYRGMRKRVNL